MSNAFAVQAFGEVYATPWQPPLTPEEECDIDWKYERWFEASEMAYEQELFYASEEDKFDDLSDYLPRQWCMARPLW